MTLFFKRILPLVAMSFCMTLLLMFVLAVFSSSILRYALDTGSVKLEDLIGYTYGALIVFSVLVAFITDKHVRVNVLPKLRTVLNNPFSNVLSALPIIAIVFLSLPAIGFSWSILEGSREPDGLGGVFIVKSLLAISFGLIAVFLCFRSKDHKQ